MTIGSLLANRPRTTLGVEAYTQSPAFKWQVQQVQRSLPQELMGGLMKVLDAMNFGLYGVANTAKALLDGDSDLAGAMWRGLTLQEKTTFTDILKSYDVPYAPVLGFILDVGLDPNTYLNFGIPVFKSAAKSLGITKAVDKTIDAIKALDPIDTLGRALVPGWKLPEEYTTLKQIARATLSAERADILEEVIDFATKIPDDVRQAMSFARTNPELIQQLPQAAQELLQKYSAKYAEYADILKEYGLVSEAAGLLDNYLPGFYEARVRQKFSGRVSQRLLHDPSFLRPKVFANIDEAKEFVKAFEPVLSMRNADEMIDYLHAAFGEATAEGIVRSKLGDVATALKDPELIKNWAREVMRFNTPIEDFAVLYGLYSDAFVRWETRNNFVKEVLQKWGTEVPNDMIVPPKGYAIVLPEGPLQFFPAKGATKKNMTQIVGELQDFIAKNGPVLQEGKLSQEMWDNLKEYLNQLVAVRGTSTAWLLPEEIAKDLTKTLGFFAGDEASSKIMRWFDKVQGAWKNMATSMRLPFHVRNMYSNWFNMWLADMSPTDIAKWSYIAAQVQRGGDTVIEELGQTAQELLDQATHLGVRGAGLFGVDVREELLTIQDFYKAASKTSIAEDIVRKLWNAPRKLGVTIEDNSRIAMWLFEMSRGKAPDEAVRTVWKYLFNYEDITPFERQIKRVVPFYTWLRKNIPLQLEMFVTKPQKYVNLNKAFNAISQFANLRHEEMDNRPDWLKKFGTFPLPWTDNKGRQLWASLDLPAVDILGGKDPMDVFSMVSPVIAGVLALGYGVKTFPPGKKIESYPGELVKAPFWAGWLPSGVMNAMGIQQMVDYNTGKRVLGWPARMQEFVYSAFPMLRELSNLVPGGGVDVEPEDAPWRRISYLTGVRITPVDSAQQEVYKELERRQKLQNVVKRIYQVGRPLTTKELEAMLR